MKKVVFTIFQIAIAIILIGKIANWFLDFSDETKRILNMVMFTLIGIAYIVFGYVFDSRLTKTIFIACGAYLILMNYIPSHVIFTILVTICILTPVLIARFSPETE
jgi:hypothetical protein